MIKLNSKAKSLKKFKLRNATIPKLKIFKVSDYYNNSKKVIDNIQKNFFKNVAIRSSATDEDKENKSSAGKYKSYLNIDSKNHSEIKKYINLVIESYKSKKKQNIFFVQEMVENIKTSGVVLTYRLENYMPCLNINYFDGVDSSRVTSGNKGSKNFIFVENKRHKIINKFLKLKKVIDEIKLITKKNNLDVEFAINNKNKVFILQIRTLKIPKNYVNNNIKLEDIYKKLEKKIIKLKKKHYSLFGKTTYFGVMPDWNPAEIVGIKPKPLALSLYRELITDHVWSENRKIYGYHDLSQFHLMTTFFGTPFVDVRIDFNSWIPKNLDKNISEKLVNHYLLNFKKKQYLHDKIEFEIIFSCLSLSTEDKLKKILNKKFSKIEIKKIFHQLKTINKIAYQQMFLDIKKIENLKKKQTQVDQSNLYFIDKIYWLIEDCKKFGTLPFAGLARCAFIATEILNSFVEQKIITQNEKLKFLSNIKTITFKMKDDLKKGKKYFVKKYGHLRPGTYEITSKNYEENFDNYFDMNKKISSNKIQKFNFSAEQIKKINIFTRKSGVYKNFDHLISFIKLAIQYREYSKFIFTKSIDLIFKNLKGFGKKYKFNSENLSYLKINEILDLYFNLSYEGPVKKLKKNIELNKSEYLTNKSIFLPDVITSAKDLYLIKAEETKINFISNKSIISKLKEFKKTNKNENLECVICIENADPGYDFLFSKNIKGLITKYGGQNSHMAIRCAELNLPALIGVGENLYREITNSKTIKIDCELKKIELIN